MQDNNIIDTKRHPPSIKHISLGYSIFIFIVYALLFSWRHQDDYNNVFYIVYLTIPLLLLLSRQFRKTILSSLSDKRLLFLFTLALIARCSLSLFAFAHINYHGYTYFRLLGHAHHATLPYGFTYNIFWGPLALLNRIGLLSHDVLFSSNLLLNISCAYILFTILRLLLGGGIAPYVGFYLFAVSPIQIRYAATESHFTLVLFLHLLLITTACLYRETQEPLFVPTFFLMLAFLTFTRPEQFIIAIPFSLFLLIYSKIPLKELLFYLTCYALIIAVPFYEPLQRTWPMFMADAQTHPGSIRMNWKNIIFPFSNTLYSNNHLLIPTYLMAIPGFIYGILGQKTRRFALGLFALYLFFNIPLSYKVFNGYFIAYLYSSYWEYIPIIFCCFFIHFIYSKYGGTISILLTLTLTLLPYTNYIKITEKYDEQIEYEFIKKHYKNEYGKIGLLRGSHVFPFNPSLYGELFQNLTPIRFSAIIGKTDAAEFCFPAPNDKFSVYFRSLSHGFRQQDEELSRQGFIPIDIKHFIFKQRYPSYPQGTPLTIGFYRYTRPHSASPKNAEPDRGNDAIEN